MATDSDGDHTEDGAITVHRDRDDEGDERDLAASRRDAVGDVRDLAGAARDVEGDVRDATGRRRDLEADERDRAAEARDRANRDTDSGPADQPTEVARVHAASDRSHAARDRLAGAQDRSTSEDDRTTSLADREAGHDERAASEEDRADGGADRAAAADERALAALDPLTGARSRRSGLTELAREMQRAERTSRPLTLAYVDIDGLKAINDSKGHAAGDAALVAVVEALRGTMREYDLVVRMGGDEFMCVLAGLDEAGAEVRVSAVTAALGADPDLPSATFGVAEMLPGESLSEFIERADAALYDRRGLRRGERDRP